jgi:phosphoenolpyruvate synthase/pyruvate phosphate dikinase
MHRLGLPVPPGFILTTGFSAALLDGAGRSALWKDLGPRIAELGEWAFRDGRPLSLAVRSAPSASMPGMMDSVLDVPPEEPRLLEAIAAVLASAAGPRARDYRRLYGLPDDLGVAVVIQAMVHGDRGDRSCAGVLFSRDPSTGEPTLYGEFLPCARGEDVVSGTRVPRPLAEMAEHLPDAFAELIACSRRLERHFGDLQDIEFTVEDGVLWLLQTRTGKRSGRAMVRIAADLFAEGLIDGPTALRRIEARRLSEVLRPTLDPAVERTLFARGLPASPGAVTGRIAFSSAEVEARARAGEPAILVRTDTSPEDLLGIKLAVGLLTTRGGMTSHAAVVARGLGRCAVVGASALSVDLGQQRLSTREHSVGRSDFLTLDGHSGEVLLGEVPLAAAHVGADRHLGQLLEWAAARRLRVYALAKSDAERRLCSELQADGMIELQPLTLAVPAAPPRSGLLVDDASALFAVATRAARGDFVLFSVELEAGLEAAVPPLRAARPDLHLGLVATRLRSDEVELVSRALALGLDFVACPPLRTAIAAVAAAQRLAQ